MKHLLNIPYELKDQVTQVRFDGKYKSWFYEGQELPEHLTPFQPKMFSLEWNLTNQINKIKPQFKYEAIWKPKEHQITAIKSIEKAYKNDAPGFLLADEVGLGKTIEAIYDALNRKEFKKILIVCPIAVIAHWRNTLINLGVDSSKEITIINFDKLGKLFEITNKSTKLTSTRKKGKQKRVAKELDAPEYDFVIIDESHKCKNIDTARSKLVDKLTAKAKFSLWVSATAGQTPLELSYLKRMLAKKTKSTLNSMKEFEIWCQNQGLGITRGKYGVWNWSGEQKDVQKVKDWLFGGDIPWGIRRRPQEIAGWKELERNLYAIDLTEAQLYEYSKSWHEFQKEEKKKVKDKKLNPLVEALRFRQKTSLLKIDATVELILEHLEKGNQVAVSVEFKETQQKIVDLLKKKKVDAVMINGSQNATEKEENRLAFQKGDVPVAIFTVVEAISLHQGEHNNIPRILLIHDIRWSAIQMAQIEGRCHRDGYFSPCYWVFANDTKDQQIGEILIKRVKNMKDMMGDDTSLLDEIMSILLKD
jgi:hypothetical protein